MEDSEEHLSLYYGPDCHLEFMSFPLTDLFVVVSVPVTRTNQGLLKTAVHP